MKTGVAVLIAAIVLATTWLYLDHRDRVDAMRAREEVLRTCIVSNEGRATPESCTRYYLFDMHGTAPAASGERERLDALYTPLAYSYWMEMEAEKRAAKLRQQRQNDERLRERARSFGLVVPESLSSGETLLQAIVRANGKELARLSAVRSTDAILADRGLTTDQKFKEVSRTRIDASRKILMDDFLEEHERQQEQNSPD